MPRKPKKQQDDEFVELPEDRLGHIEQSEPEDEEKKEIKKEHSKPAEKKQTEIPKVPRSEKSDPLDSMREDLLDDIRQELISESQVEEEPGFFQRIRGRFSKTSKPKLDKSETQPEAEGEAVIPEAEVQGEVPEDTVEPKPKKKIRAGSKEEEKAIQEFFSDLEAMADLDFDAELTVPEEVLEVEPDLLVTDFDLEVEFEPETEPEVEAQPLVSPEEPEGVEEVDFDEVRQIALEEYDGAAVEPEVEVPIREQVRSTVRDLRPVERALLIIFGVLAIGTLVFAGGYIIFSSVAIPTPVPTATVEPNTIYPIRLELPGGWQFDLSRGRVVDGEWNPRSAEWLEGTEISRWIALPGSLQLEAVLRTLNSGDEIKLTMSNFETLEYKVYSLYELTMEQIQAQNSNTPELLIILFSTEGESDTHWVVTARP